MGTIARRIGVWAALVLSALAGAAGCRREAAEAPTGAPTVRVLLFDDQPQVTLSAAAPPTVREGSGASVPRPLDLPRHTPVPVRLTPDGWRIGDAAFAPGVLTLQPASPGTLRVNGQAHRGEYRLVPSPSPGRFDVVNALDLDSYLKGVLAKELLSGWHEEAYEAQAIVARTYALYEIKSGGKGEHWDVYADVRSQVYGGLDGETSLSRHAADDTAGVVLAHGEPGRERIFKAYFSSCCGGVSQSVTDAFGEPPIQPLTDQNVGTRCNASPRFNWGPVVLPKDELTRRMRLWAERRRHPMRALARVERIDIQSVNPSGRPVRFLVTDARGMRYSLMGEELRWSVNTDAPAGTTLYSSFCTPVSDPTTVRFVDGHGWGHGVGLCQYCAQQQAQDGLPHERIVRNAFPGAVLQRAY